MPEPEAKYYVLLDTNIWVHKTHLLRTPLGVALLHVLARSNAKLALPEVVELEVQRKAKELASEHLEKARQSLAVLGHLSGHVLPLFPVTDDAARRRFDELSGLIVRFEFSYEHARACLDRVVNEIPPNSPKNQQFKDTAIWMAAMEAASVAPVYFVSQDKGFFADRDPAKGLAQMLRQETTSSRNPVTAYYDDLAACLKDLRAEQPHFDVSIFQASALEMLAPVFESVARDRAAVFGEVTKFEGSAFVTERPHRVALDATIARECTLVPQPGAPETRATLVARFSAEGNLTTRMLESFRLERFEILDAQGSKLAGQVYLYAQDDLREPSLVRPLTMRLPVDA